MVILILSYEPSISLHVLNKRAWLAAPETDIHVTCSTDTDFRVTCGKNTTFYKLNAATMASPLTQYICVSQTYDKIFHYHEVWLHRSWRLNAYPVWMKSCGGIYQCNTYTSVCTYTCTHVHTHVHMYVHMRQITCSVVVEQTLTGEYWL